MLDDFLHETTADPLNDIMNFLGSDKKESSAAPGNDDFFVLVLFRSQVLT